MTEGIATAFAATVGAVAGSFAVTAGLRLARGAPWAFDRSRCDGCGVRLSYAQTLPLLGYLQARGACRSCGGRIDPLHPGGELVGALMVGGTFALVDPARAAAISGIGLLLLAAATVDLRVRRLPNVLVALVAVQALALAVAGGPAALAAGLLAAAATAAVFLVVRGLSRRGGRPPGLGLGDVKLAAALALWLGPSSPLMILVAALMGLAAAPWLKDPEGRLPFGPMLAAGAYLVGVAAELDVGAWTA